LPQLLRKIFPVERYPDFSEEALIASPEAWFFPWLAGIRTAEQLAGLPLLTALKGFFSREQRNRLDKDAPTAIVAPSGRNIILYYTAGELQGRYPKHPWSDNPWNAVPTNLTSRKSK
jgi:ATP-dependent helicase HrpB